MPSFYPPDFSNHSQQPSSDYEYYGATPHYSTHHDLPPMYAHHNVKNDGFASSGYPGSVGYDYSGSNSSDTTFSFGRLSNNRPNNVHQAGAVPSLPPPRRGDFAPYQSHYMIETPFKHPDSYTRQEREQEKIVGGVSATLDYDMAQMTDFVVQVALGMFNPTAYNRDAVRTWVNQLLTSTRLPSATIMLSMSYMALRIRTLNNSKGSVSNHSKSNHNLFEFLTIALILGSKFLDDNTFQNKSWAEVSQIKVGILNREELNWLSSFGHRLHHDPGCTDGFSYWQDRWATFKARLATNAFAPSVDRPSSRHPRHSMPANANTTLRTDFSHGNYYAMPNQVSYDGWYPQRSAVERSPSTAPHTGPNTPDCYTGPSGWSGPEAATYSRSRQYRLPHISTVPFGVDQFLPPPPAYEGQQYSYPPPPQNMWNCHGLACQCPSCRHGLVPRYSHMAVG